MGRLDNKVAIITGGGSGMGEATSILFAKEGAKVVVADVATKGGEATVKKIKDAGGEATFVKTDVTKTEDIKKMIKTAVDTYGKLNVLVNNAGIPGSWAPTVDWTEEEYQKVMDINCKGVWLGMKYAIPEMLKAGGGSIVNISSIAADACQRGSCIYAGSKGAVTSMSLVTATEYADQNIRVNVVKPGSIRTPIVNLISDDPEVVEAMLKGIADRTPQKRLGKPEEVAYLSLFFASDESSHVTGQKLAADGGNEADSHIA
jgi:NAD(P)-dependent dehydrogenase (short-subunit alcohol dehydrogenase family)